MSSFESTFRRRSLITSPTTAVVLAAGLLGIAITESSLLVAAVVPVLVGLLALVVLVQSLCDAELDPRFLRRVLRWTIASLFAHLAFGLIVTNVGIGARYLGGDAITYHQVAVNLLRHWTEGFPMTALPGGREGYYYMLAAIYWVFGPHTVGGLAVNAVLAAALVPLLTDAVSRLFGSGAGWYVPPLAVLLPGMFQFSSQLLKEAPALFLIAASLNCAVRLLDGFTIPRVFMFSIALALLLTVRGYVAVVLVVTLILGIAVGSRQWARGINASFGSLVLLAIVVLPLGIGYSGYRLTSQYDLREANAARADLATSANSGFNPTADISTPRRAIYFLPIGLINFGLGPFPWQIRSVRQLGAVPDVVVLWALIPSVLRAIKQAWRTTPRQLLLLLLPAAALLVLFSLVIGNFGAVVRERMQVIIFAVPLMALGLSLRRRNDVSRLGAAAVGSAVR